MKYLLIANKTKNADGVYIGWFEAVNILEANKKTAHLKKTHITVPGFGCFLDMQMNDAHIRLDGRNTVPKNWVDNKLNL